MNVFENIKSAIVNVLSNKMRSFLTMLGIIIGVASVITIVAVGNGSQRMMEMDFSKWGFDIVSLYNNSSTVEDRTENDLLTEKDADYIKSLYDVAEAAPIISFWTLNDACLLKNQTETRGIQAVGVDERYFNVQNIKMINGRTITRQDTEFPSNVIVIDDLFARQLFGRTDVVGESFSVSLWNGYEVYTVVGIYESDYNEEIVKMYNLSAKCFLPLSTVRNLTNTIDTVDSIEIKVKDTGRIDDISDQVILLLEKIHSNENKKQYEAYNSVSYFEQQKNIILIFTLFLSFVAAISLLVGGIGVMNIMLVTVTERTREIGIRKSLGATNVNIQIQFLVEAVIISAAGGALGILLGYFGGNAIGSAISIPAEFSVQIALIAAIISSAVGVVFGVYPAAKASRLDPIEALRFE